MRLRALVVLPTRDLVLQVRETFEAISKGRGLKVRSTNRFTFFPPRSTYTTFGYGYGRLERPQANIPSLMNKRSLLGTTLQGSSILYLSYYLVCSLGMV